MDLLDIGVRMWERFVPDIWTHFLKRQNAQNLVDALLNAIKPLNTTTFGTALNGWPKYELECF